MNINGVNSYYKPAFQNGSSYSGTEKPEQSETKEMSTRKDTLEISAQSIEELKSEYERQANDFKDMLRKMITRQSTVNGGITATHFNFSFGVNLDIEHTGETTDSNALSGLGEDDYWGAEKTANRIFDFATSLAGDNDELLSTLKDAVQEGFRQVENMFGGEGKLPSVCYDTLDRINELFDQRLNKQDTESTVK